MNHFCPEVKDEYGRPAEAVVKLDRVCLISGNGVTGEGGFEGEDESEGGVKDEDGSLVAITPGAGWTSCDSGPSVISFTAAFSVTASAIDYTDLFEVGLMPPRCPLCSLGTVVVVIVSHEILTQLEVGLDVNLTSTAQSFGRSRHGTTRSNRGCGEESRAPTTSSTWQRWAHTLTAQCSLYIGSQINGFTTCEELLIGLYKTFTHATS